MEKKRVATLKQEDGWLLISTPSYSAAFVQQLKDAIHWKERSYADYIWKVKPEHLEIVRSLLDQRAKKEGWEVLDHTATSEEAIAEQQAALAQDFEERHVAAVLAVLPKLPPRALRLVDWEDTTLTFELREFLGSELFKELSQASLEMYRPTILFGGAHKREFKQTFIVAADERIIRALCDIAGTTPLSNAGWHSNIEYFVVRDVTLVASFDDGITHFTGEDGSFWIGYPSQENPVDLSWTREAWQVAVQGPKVYILLERQTTVKKLLAVRESQYVNPGFGNVAVAQSHPSQVAMFVHNTHCEDWFKTWGNALVQRNNVVRGAFGKPWWYASLWEHPADEIFSHTSFSRSGGKAMWNLLGWDESFVHAQKERIQQLKEAAAQAVIDDMRQRSAELALPLLEAKTIKELQAVAEAHAIHFAQSWSKTKLIQTLQTSPAITEEMIGLTKRLAGK